MASAPRIDSRKRWWKDSPAFSSLRSMKTSSPSASSASVSRSASWLAGWIREEELHARCGSSATGFSRRHPVHGGDPGPQSAALDLMPVSLVAPGPSVAGRLPLAVRRSVVDGWLRAT